MADVCVVCRQPGTALCEDDRRQTAQTIANLPDRLRRLAVELAAVGGASSNERVGQSADVEAKVPGRMAGLTLAGPGATEVPQRLHPLMRHRPVRRSVTVHGHANGVLTVYQQEITDWYQEAAIGPDGRPILVTDDDQTGILPPREWIDTTVRAWRSAFGHRVPQRTTLARNGEATRWLRLLRATPALEDRPARKVAVGPLLRAGVDHRLITAVLLPALAGCTVRAEHFGLAGYQPPTQRPLDPLADDVARRFGQPARDRILLLDIQYLLTWLDAAADQDLDMGAFTAELHALDAELARVLGDDPDKVWVGRCPAFIAATVTDGDGGATTVRTPCGAGLWQDDATFSAQVPCPRCHTVWDTRGPAAATLAREIRKVWPVDRWRRYNLDEIDRLPTLACPACRNRVIIDWKDVTGTRDKRRWWQPTETRCERGCDDARRLM